MKMLCGRITLFLAIFHFITASGSALIFTNLYDFTPVGSSGGTNPQFTNTDGIDPSGFVVVGNVIYGLAAGGGQYGFGTIFRVNTDGTHFTNIFNFNRGTYDPVTLLYPNSTGDEPQGAPLLISNSIYGTTWAGGVQGAGTVFKINLDGSGFALLKSFAFTNGQQPGGTLATLNNVVYGTTTGGGTNYSGTIFAINPDGSSFATLYNFTNDAEPYGGVIASSNALYGFARYGGPSLNGFVYRLGLAGGGFQDIYDFDGTNGSSSYASPVLSGDTLYGVTYSGGTNGLGNVFRLNTDGGHFTNLYSIADMHIDGSNPVDWQGMVLSGNTLYGTTSSQGSGGQGTVFQINTDGTGFTVLHSFQYTDGGQPNPLVLVGGTLYGMATVGASSGDGGIFALILHPTLNLSASTTNAILSWNDPSYSLYSSPTLTGTFTKIVGATSPYTNAISGGQKYFEVK